LKRLALLGIIVFVVPGHAAAMECADLWTWLQPSCRHVADTYEKGDNAVLVSGYQWHLPYDWTPERRAEENSNAWGGGVDRSRENEAGNQEDVFFLVFENSHKAAQFNLGYAWRTYWGEREKLQFGLGFAALIVQRPDIWNGVPFPAVLPLATLRHDNVEVLSAYVPKLNGGINHGSVLYIFGKIDLK
jgi:palmitoyl transferase